MTDVDDLDCLDVFQDAIEDFEIVALDGLGMDSGKPRSLCCVRRISNMLYGSVDRCHDVCATRRGALKEELIDGREVSG